MVKQPAKMSNLIVSAIRNLREIHGSTSKEIMNYIKTNYEGKEPGIQRQLHVALKRGLDYGILKRADGNYSLNVEPQVLYEWTGGPTEKTAKKKARRRRDRQKTKIRGRTTKRKRTERKRAKPKISRSDKHVERPICNCLSRRLNAENDLSDLKNDSKNTDEKVPEDNRSGRSRSRERSSSVSRSSGSSDQEVPDQSPNRQTNS